MPLTGEEIERIISADDESHQVVRMLKGGPASSLEKESIAETVREMLPALREIGVEIDMDDIFIEGPALILRASVLTADRAEQWRTVASERRARAAGQQQWNRLRGGDRAVCAQQEHPPVRRGIILRLSPVFADRE